MIELSNHIDEMRERDEKKDAELEQLRLTLYDLEDAILQQIAMKKYAEQVKSVLKIIFYVNIRPKLANQKADINCNFLFVATSKTNRRNK